MRGLMILFVAVLAGCDGNWSTEDLVFASVLPWTEDLVVRMPAAAAGLPAEGLMVGDASRAWAQTRKAAGDANGLLTQVLGFAEQVRLVAPTSRAAESRTWGPYADANNPGREVQLRVSRPVLDTVDAVFEWTIESRATGGEFLRITSGTLVTSDSARRAKGSFVVFVKDFRDVVKVTESIAQLDEITVSYDTSVAPSAMELGFVVKAGSSPALSAIGYSSRRAADGAGALVFRELAPGADGRQLEWSSRWTALGEGRAEGMVKSGSPAGAAVTECWGREGTVRHSAQAWDGGVVVGQPSDCVVTEGP